MSGQTNSPMPALADFLAALARPELKEIYYNSKDVTLDGYRFVGCRFDKCKLHVSTTNFELVDCIIDDESLIYYGGEIIKPIRLFNARYKWVYDSAAYFAPVKDSVKGTITITS